MSVVQISFEEGQANLDWLGLCRAFDQGHQLPRAEISDTFLYRGGDTLLNRSAWIDGLGLAVKCATVFPDNPKNNQPMINGGVSLFSDETGALAALVDFHLVTKWKTAGDSLCAALKLARPESKRILIVGAGTVGHSLRAAYGAGFPDAEFLIWNRTATTAEAFAAYAMSDLLCYRAEHPQKLVEKQADSWDPLLDWATSRFDVSMVVTAGILPVDQPEENQTRFASAAGEEPLRLTALAHLAALLGSAILALALGEAHISPRQAYELAFLDDLYQIDEWGVDEEAGARLDKIELEIATVARYLSAL